jgi:ribA/ribD-fused uncharacterized protein
MVSHYCARLGDLHSQARDALSTLEDLDRAVSTALSWARKNFGKKLNSSVLEQFHNDIVKDLKNSLRAGNTKSPQTAKSPQSKSPQHKTAKSPQSKSKSPQHKPSTSHQTSTQPRNVCGATDPLSNFFPCKFPFRGNWFRSAEHAYQFTKATFLGAGELADEIKQASDAYSAKKLSKILKFSDNFAKWENIKLNTMSEILSAKFNSSIGFKRALLGTGTQRITHGVCDAFWGSFYKNKFNKQCPGKDLFSHLLMNLRANKSGANTYTHTNTKQNENASNGADPHQMNVDLISSKKVSNEAHPHEENVDDFLQIGSIEEYPHLPTQTPKPQRPKRSKRQSLTPTSPTTPTTPPTPTTPIPAPTPTQPTSLPTPTQPTSPTTPSPSTSTSPTPLHLMLGPQSNSHKGDKTKWAAPKFTKQLAIIGDSNTSRISHTPEEIESIQIDSFHGAKLLHITSILHSHKAKHPAPDTLILSVGINNKDNKTQTHRVNIRNLLKTAQHKFPESKIYIPLLNFSNDLPGRMRDSLKSFNNILSDLVRDTVNVNIIPPLETNFVTGTDKIHWSPDTANAMLAHWVDHLN